MSVNIDLYIYDLYKLLNELHEWGANNSELNLKILNKCGHVFGDKYILVNNELADECDPYYIISTLFDSAYKKVGSFDIFLKSGKNGISAVDVDDIAEDLNIELDKSLY